MNLKTALATAAGAALLAGAALAQSTTGPAGVETDSTTSPGYGTPAAPEAAAPAASTSAAPPTTGAAMGAGETAATGEQTGAAATEAAPVNPDMAGERG